MKRIFCLLLCLLCLCPAALAENPAGGGMVTYDFDDFTIDVPAGAVVQEGEKTAGAAFFAVYPYYDATQAFNDNYNIVWVPQDFSLLFAQTDANSLAQAQINTNLASFAAMGVEVANVTLLAAGYDESGNNFSYYITMDLDYTGAGLDLQLTLHQVQMYMDLGDEAGYIFSFSARDAETLEALIACADTMKLA